MKNNVSSSITLSYRQGSLILSGLTENYKELLQKWVLYDERTLEYRALPLHYRDIILKLTEDRIPFEDQAAQYEKLSLTLKKEIIPRPHQEEALKAWMSDGKRKGLVSLPTGAGKTILAVLAINLCQRSTLIVVPTIDLVLQWTKVLEEFFNIPIGQVGGGEKNWQAITVSTYDSASMLIEEKGHLFGFIIFDECHHLPAPRYKFIAQQAIAPFRLGLSATIMRSDGGEELLTDLVGELIYEGSITQMVSQVLSPYDVVSVEVDLTEKERAEYEQNRQYYLWFVRKSGINFSQKNSWQQFIFQAARSPEGRKAMECYRKQKQIAQNAQAKFDELWNILTEHSTESMIIFTNDNALAYRIGQEFILPVLTHRTKAKERKAMLEAFRQEKLKVLVTSKVLNEGVDVPNATIGVVFSGSGAVREHVQRLGRILRYAQGKRAVLYEIVAQNTSETFVNFRRRQHDAYQSTSPIQY